MQPQGVRETGSEERGEGQRVDLAVELRGGQGRGGGERAVGRPDRGVRGPGDERRFVLLPLAERDVGGEAAPLAQLEGSADGLGHGLVVGREGGPAEGGAVAAARGRSLVGVGVGGIGGPERVVEQEGVEAALEVVEAQPGPRRAPASRVDRVDPDVLGDVAQRLRRLHHVAEPEGSAVGGAGARAPLVHVGHPQLEAPLAGGEVQREVAAAAGELQVDVGGGRVEPRGHEPGQAEARGGGREPEAWLAVVVDLAVRGHGHDGVLVGLLDGIAEPPLVLPHGRQQALAAVAEVVGDPRVVPLQDQRSFPRRRK